MYFFYFYPVGLDEKPRSAPLVTYTLMALTGLVFIWTRYFVNELPLHPARLIFFPGNQAPWTVITALFLHGGWLHLLGNMLYLFVFGPLLEDKLGKVRFFGYLLMMGAFGNLVHAVFGLQGWFGQPPLGVMGASGAVAGLLGFALARLYFARVEVAYWVLAPLQGQNRAGKVHLAVPVAIALWFLLQLVHMLVASETGASVSYGAHFGGFALGLFLAVVLGHLRLAQADACLVRGRRYLEQNAAMAAAGEFGHYLEYDPESLTARLFLARAVRMAGQSEAARHAYRKVFRSYLEIGRVDRAVEVFCEARRGEVGLAFPPQDLAAAAHYQEKQLDYQGALATYLDLATNYPDHPQADHALVRMVLLAHHRLQDEEQAQRWLSMAEDRLPPGAWRDYLARELRYRNKRRGAIAVDRPDPQPEPAI